MRIKQRQYPYPVLSFFSDDLPRCTFQTAIQQKCVTKTAFEMDAQCKTSNPELRNLVKEHKACYALHLECTSTKYRNLVSSFEEAFSFNLDAHEVDGRIEVCSFILAHEDLSSYRNQSFHRDYGDTSFKVKKGEVLAVAREQTIDIEKKIDPLRKFPSIFIVTHAQSPDAPGVDVDLSNDKISIILSADNFEIFKKLRQNQAYQPVISAMIVVPALVLALETIKTMNTSDAQFGDFEERKWFRVIEKRLNDFGINVRTPNSFLDTSIQIANKMVGDPLTASFKGLTEIDSDE